MPDLSCDVAIIGGGIIGTALAWNLAKAGCRDVAVIEREINPGLGSTAKAAGGIRAQFGSDINVRLSKLSIELFESFHRDVGVRVDFVQAGYLWIATQPAHMETFRRNVDLQRTRGLDVKLLDRDGVQARAPYVRLDDVVGGTFHQRDGYAPPADYVMGYHKASKDLGVKYLLETEVNGVLMAGGAVTGLRTNKGEIRAKRVVCAAGAYSGTIGKMMGVDIPVQPVRRQCFVTEKIADLPHPIPMTIDYASGVYCHTESGGVLVGMADKDEPPGFNETVDYSFIEKMAEQAMHRIPRLESAAIKTQWAGLYEVTPDHHPILGELPGVKNFYLATGFSGHGVMHAPATGKVMSELLTTGKTSIDIRPLRYERFKENDLIKETHVI